MADEIRIEHALAWRDRMLLERLVRGLEKFLLATVSAEDRAALTREIDAMVKEAERVAQQMQMQRQQESKQPEPPQGA